MRVMLALVFAVLMFQVLSAYPAEPRSAEWYKSEWCFNIGKDATAIVRARSDGVAYEDVAAAATEYELFSAARRKEVLLMIEHAYMSGGSAKDWVDMVNRDCMK